MTTPCGDSQSSAMVGHCAAATVKREFGCDDGLPDSGVQSFPCQSMRCSGASPVIPSHHTSPLSFSATLVKTVLPQMVSIAVSLVLYPVPGATPKKPASGLMARSRPSAPLRSQAMSSPIVSAFQPGIVGLSMDKLVLPHALGKACLLYTSPSPRDGLLSRMPSSA